MEKIAHQHEIYEKPTHTIYGDLRCKEQGRVMLDDLLTPKNDGEIEE